MIYDKWYQSENNCLSWELFSYYIILYYTIRISVIGYFLTGALEATEVYSYNYAVINIESADHALSLRLLFLSLFIVHN